jgi:hypothetical protein
MWQKFYDEDLIKLAEEEMSLAKMRKLTVRHSQYFYRARWVCLLRRQQ